MTLDFDNSSITKEELRIRYFTPVMGDVLEFITRRFPTAKEDSQWVSGNCFYFATILKTRFPQGYIVYDTEKGHFLFLYHSLIVDATHHYFLKKEFKPSSKNFMVTKSIVVWDYFPLYDNLQYDRIVKDCIN